jgi:hypothetical protein
MGRGFGRGAKAVAIVTHAQAKKQKKLPRGLRGGRKKRRSTYADKDAIEEGRAPKQEKNKPLSIHSQIAAVQFPSNVPRGQGFKQLRKGLIKQVKNIRRNYNEKAKVKRAREDERQIRLQVQRKKMAEQEASEGPGADADSASASSDEASDVEEEEEEEETVPPPQPAKRARKQ